MNTMTSMAATTSHLPISTSSVGPIPTVIPGVPVYHLQEMGKTGQRTLWVVTVLMGLSSLVFYILSTRAPLPKRVFHTLISLTTTISFITYLAMATGTANVEKHSTLVQTHQHVPDITHHYTRQIQALRYVNWILTSPLLFTNMALLSGLPGGNLLPAISADLITFAAGLLGTFATRPTMTWVWYSGACAAYLVTAYQLAIHGNRAAGHKDAQTRRFYGALVIVLLLAKGIYLVALAGGSLAMRMSVDTEIVLYAILDIFVQGLLGYWIILAHDGSPGIVLNVDGFWAHGFGGEGSIRIQDAHDEGP